MLELFKSYRANGRTQCFHIGVRHPDCAFGMSYDYIIVFARSPNQAMEKAYRIYPFPTFEGGDPLIHQGAAK